MADDSEAYVFDSFALLAYLGGETGMPRVLELLEGAAAGRWRVMISVINLGEVAYIVERERGLAKAQQAIGLIDQLPLEVLPASREAVLSAAHIKARFPVAYADAFAVAAALDRSAPVVTGDAKFEAVEGLVQLERI